jgi:hypothetical protein
MSKEMDEAIERHITSLYPGCRLGWVRIADGPPQRAAVMRTDNPFPRMVRKLKTPQGKPFTIQVACGSDGLVFVTWGLEAQAAD